MKVTHVKSARKAVPSQGIEVGDSYYWWKFRRGGKRYSKTYPRRSQLTQSEFLASLYDMQDDIGNLEANDDLADTVSEYIDRLRGMAEECEEKIQNMPESLHESDTANLLQSRADTCNEAADEFEQIDFEDDSETLKEKLDQVKNVSIDAE